MESRQGICGTSQIRGELGHLGGIWVESGRHLGGIWRHLVASGRHLGGVWGHLVASGRHLEARGVLEGIGSDLLVYVYSGLHLWVKKYQLYLEFLMVALIMYAFLQQLWIVTRPPGIQ